ncbi:MAG TPA: caspase family protein, partial [Pilimelia sp.]|nr:caspase family protein [Pilimelia sp.]
MPPPADLPLADATVLVAGAGTFTGGLEDVPAVRRTVTDLARLLRRRCGVPADGLRELVDPGTPVELGDAVAQAADDATGPLLLYYVGHGLVGTTGQLHLSAACSDPRPTRVAHTALAYDVVRQALLRSPGRPLVVLLDCCYSGLAVGGALGAGVADATSIDGGFVLTAAGGDELAWAPPGARYTAFGGRLIGLLRDGDASLPAQLTLRDVYRHLARELPALGLPRPRKRSSEQAESLRLCANPRRPATTGRGPAAANPPRAVPDTRCPYKGLAAFDVDDAQFFFGRTALTARLAAEVAARYDDPGIVVLAGVSGAGKSSLLQAGLRPALRRGAL